MQSVFGSAKATQEADNVIIIQHARHDENPAPQSLTDGFMTNVSPYRLIEVKKNRFDGDLGTVVFQFDKRTSRAIEVDPKAVFNAPNQTSPSRTRTVSRSSSVVSTNGKRPPAAASPSKQAPAVSEEGAPSLSLGHEVLMS